MLRERAVDEAIDRLRDGRRVAAVEPIIASCAQRWRFRMPWACAKLASTMELAP